MHEEFNRLIILLQAVYDQNSMVHKDPLMKQGLKMRFNNFDKQVEKLIADIKKAIGSDEQAQDYFEMMGVIFNETLREVQRCKDPRVALSVIQAINEGCEVTVDENKIKDYEPEQKAA